MRKIAILNFKVVEVEYEDPAILMEELISKQKEVMNGLKKLYSMIGDKA